MDIGKAFGYVFEDEKWVSKVLLGGVIAIIGALLVFIGPLIFLGYCIQTAQNVMRGNPRPLPEWDDFAGKLVKGFYAFVVGLVYNIPIILLSCIVGGIGSAAMGASQDRYGNPSGAGFGIYLLLQGVLWIISIIWIPIGIAGILRFIQTDSMAESFKFGDTWQLIRSNIGPILILFLINLLIGFIAGLGAIACFVGLFFTVPYALLVYAHAQGQTAARIAGMSTVASVPPYTPPTTYQ